MSTNRKEKVMAVLDIISNPWLVKSLQDFTFICCPECVFKSNDPVSFECHALENHPSSIDFFQIDKATVVLDCNVISKYKSQHNLQEISFDDIDIKEEVLSNKDPLHVDFQRDRDVPVHAVYEDDCKENTFSENMCNSEHEETNGDLFTDTKLSSEAELIHARQRPIKVEIENENDLREIDAPNNVKDLLDYNDDLNGKKLFEIDNAFDEVLPDISDNISEENVEDIEEDENDKCVSQSKTTKPAKEIPLYRRQCYICMKECLNVTEKRKHIIKEHSKITCAKCGQEFETVYKLGRHFGFMHRSCACKQCGRNFTNPILLKRHMLRAHVDKNEKNFVCDKCPYRSYSKLNLDAHKLKMHKWKKIDGDDLVECETCHKQVKSRMYITHYKNKHGRKLPPHITDDQKKVCEFCSEEFRENHLLQSHIENIHGAKKTIWKQKTIVCKLCNEKFHLKCDYIKHYEDAHNALPPEYVEKEKFPCEYCEKVFFNKILLNHHIKTAHTEEWAISRNLKFKQVDVQCANCEKVFSNKILLSHHIKTTHAEERTISRNSKCQHCDKQFKYHTSYIEHVKIVHEKKHNFECSDCSMKFYHKSKYNDHRRKVTHTRPRNILSKCDICDEGPFNKRSLKRHKWSVHSLKIVDDNVECPICNKIISDKNNLKKHIKVHEKIPIPKEEFFCKLCDVKFKSLGGYATHYKFYHKDLPPEYEDKPKFYCDKCGNVYVTEKILNIHS